MKAFYNKVISVFDQAENKEQYLEQNIPFVGYIDLYAGQDQFEENFELFAQPALLIDWGINYETEPPTATITAYCCYEQLRDTSNISLNRDKALKFLDFISITDSLLRTIETETTGKLNLVSEGFNKMDSIVDIYLFTYECSYTGRKKSPRGEYQEGEYDKLNLKTNLVRQFDF